MFSMWMRKRKSSDLEIEGFVLLRSQNKPRKSFKKKRGNWVENSGYGFLELLLQILVMKKEKWEYLDFIQVEREVKERKKLFSFRLSPLGAKERKTRG